MKDSLFLGNFNCWKIISIIELREIFFENWNFDANSIIEYLHNYYENLSSWNGTKHSNVARLVQHHWEIDIWQLEISEVKCKSGKFPPPTLPPIHYKMDLRTNKIQSVIWHDLQGSGAHERANLRSGWTRDHNKFYRRFWRSDFGVRSSGNRNWEQRR